MNVRGFVPSYVVVREALMLKNGAGFEAADGVDLGYAPWIIGHTQAAMLTDSALSRRLVEFEKKEQKRLKLKQKSDVWKQEDALQEFYNFLGKKGYKTFFMTDSPFVVYM